MSSINSTSSSSSDVIDLTSSSSEDIVDGEAITTSTSRSRRKSITPDRYTDLPQTKRTRVSRQSSTTTRQTKRVSTLNKQSSKEDTTTTTPSSSAAAGSPAAGSPARKISSARQNQRAFLNQRSEEGTGGKFYFKNRVDNDDAMEASNDTAEYTGKNINGYFEVDEILDRRTRKYGSEANGLRHVVEYCK